MKRYLATQDAGTPPFVSKSTSKAHEPKFTFEAPRPYPARVLSIQPVHRKTLSKEERGIVWNFQEFPFARVEC
jgi:hypothetical protein